MDTIETPLGPVVLPAEDARRIRAALQQRHDDGLQAGYERAEQQQQRRDRKRATRPIFVGIDLTAMDMAA